LVAAHMLEDGKRIRAVSAGRVEYHHILLDRHNILLSEGVLTESYFPGNTSWDVLTAKDKEEIRALFPAIAKDGPAGYGDLCRVALKKREALVLKHYLGQLPADARKIPARRATRIRPHKGMRQPLRATQIGSTGRPPHPGLSSPMATGLR